MLGCEVLFGEAQGARIRAEVEDAIGQPCPCIRGLVCPLLGPPIELEVPRPRVPQELMG